MKKSTKLMALVGTLAALALPMAANAKTMSAKDVQDLTKSASGKTRTAYVFGKHVYVGSITTAQLVEAAGTLDGETNPVLYFVDSTGSWTNAVTNTAATVTEFNIVKAANLAAAVVDTESKEADTNKVDATTLSFDDDKNADIKITKIQTIKTDGITLGSTKLVDTDKLIYNVNSTKAEFNGKKLTVTENSPLLAYTATNTMTGAAGNGEWIGLLITLNKSFNASDIELYFGTTKVTFDATNVADFGGGSRDILVWVSEPADTTFAVKELDTTSRDVVSEETYTLAYTSINDLFTYRTTTQPVIALVTENVEVAQAKVDEYYYNIFYTNKKDYNPTTIKFREDGNLKAISADDDAYDLIEVNTNGISATEYNKELDYMKDANSEWNQNAITSVRTVKNTAKKANDLTAPDYIVTVTYDKEFKELATKSSQKLFYVNMDLSVANAAFTSIVGAGLVENNALVLDKKDYVVVGLDATATMIIDTETVKGTEVTFNGVGADKVIVRFVYESAVPQIKAYSAVKGSAVNLYTENNTATTAELNANTYYKLMMNSFDTIAAPVQDKDVNDKLVDSYTVTLQANADLKANTYIVNTTEGQLAAGNADQWIAVLLTFTSGNNTIKATSLGVEETANVKFVRQLVVDSANAEAKKLNDANIAYVNNIGGNANTLLAWVKASAVKPQVVVKNVDTGDTTTVTFDIKLVNTGIVPKVGDTVLRTPTVTNDYKDVVSYDLDSHDFTVNKGVWQFDVNATVGDETGLYTVYAKNPSGDTIAAQDWTFVKTLKYKEVLADTNKAYADQTSDDAYNAKAINTVSYDKDTNTINVVLNKKLASASYNLFVNLGTYVDKIGSGATELYYKVNDAVYAKVSTAAGITAFDYTSNYTDGDPEKPMLAVASLPKYHLDAAWIADPDNVGKFIQRTDYATWVKSNVADKKENYALVSIPVTDVNADGKVDDVVIYFSTDSKVNFPVTVKTTYVEDNGLDMKLTSASKVVPTLDDSYYYTYKTQATEADTKAALLAANKPAGVSDLTLAEIKEKAVELGIVTDDSIITDGNKDTYRATIAEVMATNIALADATALTNAALENATGLTVNSTFTETKVSDTVSLPTVTMVSDRLFAKYNKIGIVLNLRTDAKNVTLDTSMDGKAEIEVADLTTKLGGSVSNKTKEFVLWIDKTAFTDLTATKGYAYADVKFVASALNTDNKSDEYTIRVVVEENVADFTVNSVRLAASTAKPFTKDLDNTNYAFNQSHIVTPVLTEAEDVTTVPRYEVKALYNVAAYTDLATVNGGKQYALIMNLGVDLDNIDVNVYTGAGVKGVAYANALLTTTNASKYGASGKEFVVLVDAEAAETTTKLLFTNKYTGKTATLDVITKKATN